MPLYNHQKEIIKENKERIGLFLGTGSGKTLTALHLARGKTLVIAPKTTRDDGTWTKDGFDMTVISKEDLRLGKYDTTKHYDTLILDEAHTLGGLTPYIRHRNRVAIPKTSQVFEKLLTFIEEKKPSRLYILTATPTKTPMTVLAFAWILGYKWDFYKFRDTFYFCRKQGFRELWLPRQDTKERLGQVVRKLGYTGRLEDYADVPEQTYRTEWIEMTKEQKERVKELLTEYPDPLVLTGKRHQVENGVLKGDEFSDSEEIKDKKIERIQELAMEFPKMIIFAKYTGQVEKIKNALKDYKVLTLQGNTKDRGLLIREAEESKECVMIIQSQISAGFELPSFPVMVFASMSYAITDYLQGVGRILRVNKLKKNLYIHLVVKGGVDQAVYEAIQNKQDFHTEIYSKKQSPKIL